MMKLRRQDVLGEMACRAATGYHVGANAFPVHCHDFPEVFWIVRGKGLHFINGNEIILKPSTLVFIRAKDEHGFASDTSGMVLFNVAIQPTLLAQVKKRHFLNDDSFWSVADGLIPEHHTLTTEQTQCLNTEFGDLATALWTRFHAERFILNLLHCVHRASLSHREVKFDASDLNLPTWLSNALDRWTADVTLFCDGTPALARVAGRSPEHVSRAVRRWTGRTPTSHLNEARLRFAAHQLRITDRKILDIVFQCGFQSLGHFYSLFVNTYGCTPREYRTRFYPRQV